MAQLLADRRPEAVRIDPRLLLIQGIPKDEQGRTKTGFIDNSARV